MKPRVVLGADGVAVYEWTVGLHRLGVAVEFVRIPATWYYVDRTPGRGSADSGLLRDLTAAQLRALVLRLPV